MRSKVKVPKYVSTDDQFMLTMREGYPLLADDALEFLKFLVVFSVGCAQFRVPTDVFERRLQIFICDMSAMGYHNNRILSMLAIACNYFRLF